MRRQIFQIHLKKRNLSLSNSELDQLAVASDGFSGAEIEQAVVATLYTANSHRTAISLNAILAEIRATKPLSVVMQEKLSALRDWADGRAVPAG